MYFKIHLLVFLFFAGFQAVAQKKANPSKAAPQKQDNKSTNQKPAYNEAQNMEVVADQEVKFKGSDDELMDIFQTQITFNEESISKNAEGEVMLSFFVLPDSSVVDPVVLKPFGFGVDEQAVALVKQLKFIPASINGTVIKSQHAISIPLRAFKKL